MESNCSFAKSQHLQSVDDANSNADPNIKEKNSTKIVICLNGVPTILQMIPRVSFSLACELMCI